MLLPSIAAACPSCVGNSDRSTDILKLVGAFMLVPFTVFYVIWRVIKRAQNTDPSGMPLGTASGQAPRLAPLGSPIDEK